MSISHLAETPVCGVAALGGGIVATGTSTYERNGILLWRGDVMGGLRRVAHAAPLLPAAVTALATRGVATDRAALVVGGADGSANLIGVSRDGASVSGMHALGGPDVRGHGAVTGVVCSPDGSRVAVVREGTASLALFSAATGALVWAAAPPAMLCLRDACFRDASSLVGAGTGAGGALVLFDTRVGGDGVARAPRGPDGGLHCIARRSESEVFTGSEGGAVSLWDLRRLPDGPAASKHAHEGHGGRAADTNMHSPVPVPRGVGDGGAVAMRAPRCSLGRLHRARAARSRVFGRAGREHAGPQFFC